MATRDLLAHWNAWLDASDKLTLTLHEQTAAVILRDVARVERLQPEIDALLTRIKEIDDHAVATAKRLAEERGAEPSLRGLVAALEKTDAQQVQALANRIMVAARDLEVVLEKNRTLIQNELEFIGGTLALVAKAAGDSESRYGGSRQSSAVVLDRAA